MNKYRTVVCVLASLVAASALAADLTAAQIVDKNVAARGGLEAWRAVTSLTLAGKMDAGGKQDTRLPFVMTLARPHKSRLELTFQGKTAVQVYDGTQGWKVRPFLNRNDVDPYTPAEAQSAAATAELDGPLIDYARKGSKVESQGTELVEGKKAYKLKLTTKDGKSSNVWVDATSFLDVKVDGEPRKLDGKVRKVAVFNRDFKTVKGLVIAHTEETVVEGVTKTQKTSIETVTLNRALDAKFFSKPQPAPTAAPVR